MDKLRKTIFKVIKEIKEDSAVEGIIITGGIATKSYDRHSDIDLVIILNKHSNLKEGKKFIYGLLFDIRTVHFDDISRQEWSENMYYAYFHGKILYDKWGDVKRLIQEKKRYWKSSVCFKGICLLLTSLSVIYFFHDNWRNL